MANTCSNRISVLAGVSNYRLRTMWDMRTPPGISRLVPFISASGRHYSTMEMKRISKVRIWPSTDNASYMPSHMVVYSRDGYILEDRQLDLDPGTFNDIHLPQDYTQSVIDDVQTSAQRYKYANSDLTQAAAGVRLDHARLGDVEGYNQQIITNSLAARPLVSGDPVWFSPLVPRTKDFSGYIELDMNPSGPSSQFVRYDTESIALQEGLEVTYDNPLRIRQGPGSLSMRFDMEIIVPPVKVETESQLTVAKDLLDDQTLTLDTATAAVRSFHVTTDGQLTDARELTENQTLTRFTATKASVIAALSERIDTKGRFLHPDLRRDRSNQDTDWEH